MALSPSSRRPPLDPPALGAGGGTNRYPGMTKYRMTTEQEAQEAQEAADTGGGRRVGW